MWPSIQPVALCSNGCLSLPTVNTNYVPHYANTATPLNTTAFGTD